VKDLTLREVLQCARPLFFEDVGEDLYYSCGGTFFFARFQNRHFAITAKHCLADRNPHQIRLLIPNPTKTRAFFSPKRVSVIDNDLADSCDLAFIEIDESNFTGADRTATWFLDLDTLLHLPTTLQIGDGIGTRGSAKYSSGIEYDEAKINTGFTALSGKYVGMGNEKFIHKFQFDNLNGVPSLNGLSGSPVFKIVQNPKLNAYWFVGVLLQGTVESGLGHFVDSRIIRQCLYIFTNT
jgi:hypothetical protein